MKLASLLVLLPVLITGFIIVDRDSDDDFFKSLQRATHQVFEHTKDFMNNHEFDQELADIDREINDMMRDAGVDMDLKMKKLFKDDGDKPEKKSTTSTTTEAPVEKMTHEKTDDENRVTKKFEEKNRGEESFDFMTEARQELDRELAMMNKAYGGMKGEMVEMEEYATTVNGEMLFGSIFIVLLLVFLMCYFRNVLKAFSTGSRRSGAPNPNFDIPSARDEKMNANQFSL